MADISELVAQVARLANEETEVASKEEFPERISWPVECVINRGLQGAITNETRIGFVHGTKGRLSYRGFDIFDLCISSTFEESCYILIKGSLPTATELEAFTMLLKESRAIPEQVITLLRSLPTDTHPMSAMMTGVCALGTFDCDADDASLENTERIVCNLVSKLATVAAIIGRLQSGKEPVAPDPSLSHAENFMYMLTGEKQSELANRVVDIALILHADHGMNVSTFTGMVINSSLADVYSSIAGAIGSLKGPLHGGANEATLRQFKEIGSVENVDAWYENARSTKRKIMGVGHRVYKTYDPRSRIFGPLAAELAKEHSRVAKNYEIAESLLKRVVADLGESKGIFPNVDYYTGLVYDGLGIESGMFTPIFACARVAGWGARILEYLDNNRLFRPKAVYTGPVWVPYVKLEDR